jgi:RNA polymerase sigma-70 factor (ECF subfamily)
LDDFSEQLIERYFDRVHAYVRLRVPQQDCEDMVGDIFLRAMERKTQLRGEAGAWLFSIARSRIADYYRDKLEREPVMALATTESEGAPAPSVLKPPGTIEPLQRMERAEFSARLLRQINTLSELERDVIALKFTDGLTNVEIAEMLKLTPNHLGVVLHRALAQLRGAMLKEL